MDVMTIIKDLIGWASIVDSGTDSVVYFSIAAIATFLFVARLILMLFGADDGDVDISADALDADPGHMGSGAAFNLFSLLAILAFFMGLGWMGLACRVTWELGPSISVAISLGTGVGMMVLASTMMMYVKRLEHVVAYDANTSIGKTGRVYLTIPGGGKSGGQVEINISGRRKIMNAKTHGEELAAFTSIKVIEVGDDETLVVEPV
tara:strand:+ start:837 stop:1454 length:618 start_codon:yes stop_codon:yes gene_type:complete